MLIITHLYFTQLSTQSRSPTVVNYNKGSFLCCKTIFLPRVLTSFIDFGKGRGVGLAGQWVLFRRLLLFAAACFMKVKGHWVPASLAPLTGLVLKGRVANPYPKY